MLAETVFEAVLIGIAIGIVWIAIWSYFGLPIVSMLIPNFFLGFIFAAATYYSGAGKKKDLKMVGMHIPSVHSSFLNDL